MSDADVRDTNRGDKFRNLVSASAFGDSIRWQAEATKVSSSRIIAQHQSTRPPQRIESFRFLASQSTCYTSADPILRLHAGYGRKPLITAKMFSWWNSFALLDRKPRSVGRSVETQKHDKMLSHEEDVNCLAWRATMINHRLFNYDRKFSLSGSIRRGFLLPEEEARLMVKDLTV